MDRRTALRTALRSLSVAALTTLAAPAILRGRYRLFADSPVEYSARTIALMRASRP